MRDITVYTDGSCNNSKNKNVDGAREGGWGAVIAFTPEDATEISVGTYINTTSSRMEITAVSSVLKVLEGEKNAHITVWTDNQYVVNTLMKGWIFNWAESNFEGRANDDLWKDFLESYYTLQKNRSRITIKWVKGHAGHPLNEKCDELANKARKSRRDIIDDGIAW